MEAAIRPKRAQRLLRRKKPTLDDLRREMQMVSVGCMRVRLSTNEITCVSVTECVECVHACVRVCVLDFCTCSHLHRECPIHAYRICIY